MIQTRNFYYIIIFGIAFTYVLYTSYHFDNIFRHFFFLFFGLIVLYNFYNSIFDSLGNYKSKKSLKKDKAFISGLIIILINISVFSFYELKLNSKTLIKIDNYGLYADFKKNGQYIIKSGSWGSKKYFYGNYTVKNSIITLDNSYFDDILFSKKFKIRDSNENGKSKTRLFQLDNRGNIIGKYSFEIVEDNRN